MRFIPSRRVLCQDLLVMIDVRARGWDEQIRARMPLFQLTPAP
jgi:hypothetical protein